MLTRRNATAVLLASMLAIFTITAISSNAALATDPNHSFTVTVHGEPYNITLASNSTLSAVTMRNETVFSFNTTGTSGTIGFLSVTICKTVNGTFPPGQQDKIKVTFDGTRLNATSSGLTRSCLWLFFTYHQSSHIFTFDVSQLTPTQAQTFPVIPPTYLLLVLIPLASIPILYKRRARA
jgi:hypothetical protein